MSYFSILIGRFPPLKILCMSLPLWLLLWSMFAESAAAFIAHRDEFVVGLSGLIGSDR
jgi:hypothetical protein